MDSSFGHVRADMNYNSKDVINAIVCETCFQFYIRYIVTVNKHLHNYSNNNFKVFPLYEINWTDLILTEAKNNE